MRLAYIIGTFPQPSETFIAREVEGLRSRGHQVHLFSLFVPPSGAVEGVNYGWTSLPNRLNRRLFPEYALGSLAARWRSEFAEIQCNAVLAHFGSLPSTVALEAAGELPIFFSLHARDIYVEAEMLAEKIAHSRAVITCTQSNVDYLQSQFSLYAEKIHLIYHGIQQRWLDQPVPKRNRKAEEPLRLLAVGRMVEKKGFRYLLDACALLQTESFPFSLTIVGDGELHGELQKQRNRLGLQEKVTLKPWMSEELLRAEYARADLFCCPSVIAADGDRDGLPNTLVEAMACGLPVVGSRLSGIPEGVEDGVNGFLTSPENAHALADAILKFGEAGLIEQMGMNAQAKVKVKFYAEKWLEMLERLLASFTQF